MRTGVATFTLDTGKCPRWLFERMVRLARVITEAIVREFGPEEFLRRMSDPVWFQSFGTVLAFDWNASGLTTTTLGALKEALRGSERHLGVFLCGGKGKTSRKTPEEILRWSEWLGFDPSFGAKLVYASKAAAKVDSALIQDGFTLYHHSFFFTQSGLWAVVQQGMNTAISRARRYHWLGGGIKDFIEEPHTGIASQLRLKNVLNLTSKKSKENRAIALEIIQAEKSLYRDLRILRDLSDPHGTFKILELPDYEFRHHPIADINFSSPRLQRSIEKIIIGKPGSFESLMMTPGVGAKTMRALSLVAEVIYGAKPSYEDPARYSFALGGKDGTPYPVDRKTYDETLIVMEQALRKSQLGIYEKERALRRVEAAFHHNKLA